MTAANPKSRTGRGTERGFTLLELLVALAILAMGLSLVLGSFSQALDRGRNGHDEDGARVLAASLLAQALARPDPAMGEIDGRSRGFSWQVQMRPYGSAADQAAWNGRAAEITVSVSWRRTGKIRRLAMSSLRFRPKAQS